VDDLISEFLTETNENLSELDIALIQLEQDPTNKDLLSKIFRVMHTIKGTSGFLNLPRLGSVAHKAEDLLGLFRDDKLTANPTYVSLILDAVDRIKMIIVEIGNTGKEPDGDDNDLIARLAAACAGDSSAAPAPAPKSEPVVAEPVAATPETPTESMPPEAQSAKPVATPAVATTQTAESNAPAQSLRVNVDVLEDLMTLVSELVLTRNQILQIARKQKDTELTGSFQRLNQIVSDLQEGVMKTRMQPVGSAWSKLTRIIRDIAKDLGKKIDLEMHGEDTELDRQVLELIKDPLTHMVRNSADHGLEKPEDRIAAGKPETGKIRLNAYHEGGHIIMEIADDGRGLSLEKIKSKIIQNSLATESEVANMSQKQIQQYIFAAGFSTAEKVTSVSGRGVGMDVVRSNIEKIGGAIEMNSIQGQGTTFTIKIPLTLAIVSSLIVGIENDRFAIPQLDVSELVMVSANGANRIEMLNDTPVFRLRGRILPLIDLRSLLGFPEATDNRPRYIAVINAGSFTFGIIVERVFDTEEIVVKPVSSLLSGQTVFSGNTILGDGQVIMILDSAGIVRTSGIESSAASMQRDQKSESEEAMAKDKKHETPLLLFSSGNDALKAVPLEHVARLEEVDIEKLEYAGGQRVIQYGDSLMPIHLFDKTRQLPETGNRPVIVFKTREGLAGLLVDRILDITSHYGDYQMRHHGSLEGSAIIDGKATDIINLSCNNNNSANGNGHYNNGSSNGATNGHDEHFFEIPNPVIHEMAGGLK
jgi:two-component system chemotaxis sensor kinase CheA